MPKQQRTAKTARKAAWKTAQSAAEKTVTHALRRTYIYQNKSYGPGESVEIPQGLATALGFDDERPVSDPAREPGPALGAAEGTTEEAAEPPVPRSGGRKAGGRKASPRKTAGRKANARKGVARKST